MATRTDTLEIYQGRTFRQTFACSLSEFGISDIEAWASGAQWKDRSTFHVSFLDAANPRYELLTAAYVWLDGNNVTLVITKEGTDLLRECSGRGRYVVKVRNGPADANVNTIMQGTFELHRTSWLQTDLQTAWEDFDGLVQDCAAKYDATASPADKRLYVAHGRKVSAVRISDATQMIAEDMYFSGIGSALRERPLALHIDSTNNVLYVLTSEGGLYAKNITTQSAPTDKYAFLNLSGYLVAGETMFDVATWDGVGEEVIVVLTSRKAITVKVVASVLTVMGQTASVSTASPLTDANPVPASSVNTLLIVDLARVTLGKDGDGRVVAYIIASARGYELVPASRPFSRVLLLCDLGLAGGYVAPALTTAGAPYCVFYNPFPVTPANWTAHYNSGIILGVPTILKTDYHVFDVEVFDAGAVDWLFVAHGRRNQVKKIDVTHAFTTGIVVGAAIACHPNYPATPYTAQDIAHVHVDPTNINHLLIIEEDNDGPRVINGNPPTTITALANTQYGAGCSRNDAVIAISGKHFTVWTFDAQTVAYTFRVLDGSTNTPTALFEKWWFMNSDGMVAYPPNTIYQLSFGGVVPYRRTLENGGWEPDTAGYQPSAVDNPFAPGTTLVTNTELVAIGHDVSAAGDSRLFTAAASKGFMEFKINADTLRPGPARLFLVPPYVPYAALPGWTTSEVLGTYYTNDVVYTTIDGVPYVFIDVTNREISQWAVVAFRYNALTDNWDFKKAAIVQSTAATYTIMLLGLLNVTSGLPHKFIFAQSVAAVFSVRIDLLESEGRMDVCDILYLNDISPTASNDGSTGHVICGSRLIVHVWPFGGNSSIAQLRVYDFDVLNGCIVQGDPVQILQSTDVTLPAGHSWGKAFNLRAHPYNDKGSAALYLCGTSGTVIEFEYEQGSSTPLTFKSSWQSDYTNAICDARGYDFGDGLQVLVSKNLEGFAILNPSAFKRTT